MILPSNFSDFSITDLWAVTFLVFAWLGIGWCVEHPPARYPSVSHIMQSYRREWMRQFVSRQPRIFDATIMDSLRQGTSFFASACMIAIGGGVALIGNTDRLQGVANDLSLLSDATAVWEVKILIVLLFVTNAMLKFVWSHRLFGYCAILMAAVPNDPNDPAAYKRAAQAAEVNIHAARNFNRGLSSVYFSLAALGWLLGPWGLVAATVATLFVTGRREFASRSRRVLIDGMPTPA